jgi:glycosyltransferase involved in cell wall biosynthesis
LQDITVIILTLNEEKHIARCINSLLPITNKILIIDSGSNDNTIKIAEDLGAKVLKNSWVSYAFQFNFGIKNNPFHTKWLMRMDADEYILPELATEINEKLPTTFENTHGFYIKRRVIFMNKWIKNGGYYPYWLLRIWRNGSGICEESWMDEHIRLEKGETQNLENDLVDHNLNNLTWWTNKHNNYANREVIDLLNLKYEFNQEETVKASLTGTQEQRTRWIKKKYANFPLFTRPFIYFHYRYIFRLGFLDGAQGMIWHFLQGFWYRFLVDAKIYEAYRKAGKSKEAIIQYIADEFGKDVLRKK